MPPLMSTPRRRKDPTPTISRSREDAWDTVLKVLGFESLNPSDRPIPTIEGSSSTMAGDSSNTPTSGEASGAGAPRKKLSILDLPTETQKHIFSFSSQPDLIVLSLVSKHMRDIAAAHLYRSFHIVFPDDEDLTIEFPIDSLASGLETFVTSEYDYARYLREMILEPLSAGIKGEAAYRYMLYDSSSGKFLNTLLLLTLRKTKALETFKWDIRVELSREVFRALHKLENLQHLHLRMQFGDSIYQIAPPLPTSATSTPPSTYSATPLLHNNHPTNILISPTTQLGYPATAFVLINKGTTKSQQKVKPVVEPNSKSPPTISGFKNLKSLSIVEIDSHDYMEEIQACLEKSSSTLTCLKMSFNEGFAGKTRKPPPELHSDDESDIEDEFGQLIPPPPPPGASDPNGPNKTLKALEESKKQDVALAKIFGIDTAVPKPKSDSKKSPKGKKLKDDPTQPIKKLVNFYGKFMSQAKPGGEHTPEGKEALDMIEKATRKFLDVCDQAKPLSVATNGTSPAINPFYPNSSTSGNAVVMSGGDGASDESDGPGLFDGPEKKKEPVIEPGISNPDDVDVEGPDDTNLEGPDDDDTNTETTESEAMSTPVQELNDAFTAVAESPWRASTFPASASFDELKEQEEEEDEEEEVLTGSVEDVEVEATPALVKKSSDILLKEDDETAQMSKYIRKTRGLTLETLALYLIPTRASVLTKAIDLSVLRNITLLTVGSQTSFWNCLDKENKQQPLVIRKIHTDNVTLPFVNLVSHLEHIEELYMLERLPKRGDTVAIKTVVTMEHIRKAILKKHVSKLKVLMLRNDATADWDFNVKATMLLCQRATNLEELTATFVSKAFHTLLQFFSGLIALRAFHILVFRHQDNSDFTRGELPRLIIDSVSNHPELKLEYLACIDIVERLVRRKIVITPKRTAAEKKAKSQKSIKATQSNYGITSDMLDINSIHSKAVDAGLVTPYDWQDSSDDEVENMYGKHGLKLETLILRPCDVIGVKIFEKEILTGRL